MASSSSHRNSMITLFPGMNSTQSDNAERSDTVSDKPPVLPMPMRATNVAAVPASSGPGAARPGGGAEHLATAATPHLPFKTHVQHRFLTPAEWARVAHGLGAMAEAKTGGDEEHAQQQQQHVVAHPTCWYWRVRGLPDGLYRAVVFQVDKNRYAYHALSITRWLLLILQIVLGATITALASAADSLSGRGDPIPILAAINTVGAGVLALMHNSGAPDRYRMNKVEFGKVEDFIKEILDTGIVKSTDSADDVLSECFERFQSAKSTVMANMPEHYATPPPAVPAPAQPQHQPQPAEKHPAASSQQSHDHDVAPLPSRPGGH